MQVKHECDLCQLARLVRKGEERFARTKKWYVLNLSEDFPPSSLFKSEERTFRLFDIQSVHNSSSLPLQLSAQKSGRHEQPIDEYAARTPGDDALIHGLQEPHIEFFVLTVPFTATSLVTAFGHLKLMDDLMGWTLFPRCELNRPNCRSFVI
jgi:hypothetical protein